MANDILNVDSVTVRFGGIVALNQVSIGVKTGTIQAVIGPNGAGKSTLLNVVTGLYRTTAGNVSFAGESISNVPPHQIARMGIARSFQNTELFSTMSALDNVMIGLDRHFAAGTSSCAFHTPNWRRSEAAARERAKELLALVGLEEDEATAAATLPFGKQRRLEIARALATSPSLLLLDEPAAGLRAAEIEALNQILLGLRDQHKMTILVIDHVMALVMAISDRVSVLSFGTKIAEGTPDEVRRSPEVIKAYLGEKAANALNS
ncbi:ABC transporter ATP-binding protein [Ensifer adhaerens]|uniref:ABC transporter ATP-binding protein n=1 Tax=Ensifer adhaerens TaxID=106592 RepID=UPI001CBA6EE7|nr:ABC transporter ATP-binding protein [Ensifer adhaerens]MBZ7924254.1 ABC transporter ATP-binding protein [Ensifer adhaerens]UAX97584.1 ABC transporter ATP-binding protein [Ensifer adhaerens]UAY04164.1 ABC transporter ATP-binding protein [Ensifer adhaerens]UAY12150.1 ABC transporter ATP-binding protein [Ensifer adhaerens]